MSRKMLVTLIVLMALVLSGLILIQTNLIKSASDIREEQFDQMVSSGLKQVVELLEIYEEKLARESVLLGRLPESNQSNNINIFPRQSTGQPTGRFRFRYSENSLYGNFQEEFEILFFDSVQSYSDHPGSVTSFEKLHEFNLEQERRREKWLKDINWRNYEILYLEGRPLRERIDSAFLAMELAEMFKGMGIDLEYKYAVRSANQGQDTFVLG